MGKKRAHKFAVKHIKKAKMALKYKKQRIKTLLQNSFDEFDSVYKALA